MYISLAHSHLHHHGHPPHEAKHQQLCTQNKHWRWHLNVQYKASESTCEVVITYLCQDSKHKQLHCHYCLRSLKWTPKVGARATTHRGVIIHVQCDRLGTPAVNHIYYVHLRWVCVFRGIGGFLCWEYMLAQKVNTLGNRRLLSVTSTLLLV